MAQAGSQLSQATVDSQSADPLAAQCPSRAQRHRRTHTKRYPALITLPHCSVESTAATATVHALLRALPVAPHSLGSRGIALPQSIAHISLCTSHRWASSPHGLCRICGREDSERRVRSRRGMSLCCNIAQHVATWRRHAAPHPQPMRRAACACLAVLGSGGSPYITSRL
jgi:hypothetical protein